MKQKLLFIICNLLFFNCFSQELKVNYAECLNQRLFDFGSNHAKKESLSDLQFHADQGDSKYLNLLGLVYREGLGVEKDEDKAFELIMSAAKKEFPSAEFNLGRFYMIGLGCDIDFDKAIKWLTLSADHGNERAAYALGYIYFKGFGVGQDYKKAVSWFELSPWPMAKHYLGICYYFGYGVDKNEDKAIVYFSQSQTTNSDMFLKHIAENVKESVEAGIAKEVNEKVTHTNTAIEKEAIDKTTDASNTSELPTKKRELKSDYFNGKWKGKLIELDWSRKQISSIVPLSFEFSGKENTVNYKLEIENTVTENIAIFENNALYFDKQFMTFNLPYSENPNSSLITWQLLSSEMEFKTINKKIYLTGSLNTFSNEWKESGPPMQIILKLTEEGDEDLTKEEILTLSQQKNHFITLYPNPFENDVLIEYELENSAKVNVSVYDLTGNASIATFEENSSQIEGKYRYTLNGGNLRPGMYIVRVSVGSEMHSRILVKK